MYSAKPKLSLGELRSATSGLETVLLSLLHTRVTGEEACCLESGLVSLVREDESAAETVTDRTCLSGETAALNGCNDIELAGSVGYAEGLVNDELKGLETEVLIDVLAIDGDSTGTGIKTNASYRALSSASAVKIRLSASIHYSVPSFP